MRLRDYFSVVWAMGKATEKPEPRPDLSTHEGVLAMLTEIRAAGGWNYLIDTVNFRGLRLELLRFRQAQEITREDLADRTDLPLEEIEAFETDFLPDPTLSFMRRYALGLGVKYEYDVVEQSKEWLP